MAKCTVCEKEMGFADKVNAKSFDGLCRSCTDHNRKIAAGLEDKTIEEAAFDTRELDATIDAIMLTTSHTLQGIEVTKFLGVVSAECAYGMNMFKDMFANVRNLVGGRSSAVQDTMRDSRETVMQELKREAHAKGANAVIAVDIDYTQLGAGGNMMVLVSASGTAVVIEE